MGYISEDIDIQSQQGATLHMITIRVILSQFTMIGRNSLYTLDDASVNYNICITPSFLRQEFSLWRYMKILIGIRR